MDIVSHALWGYAVLRWRGPRTARWGLLTGAAPDLLFSSAGAVHRLLTEGWEGLRVRGGSDPAIWRNGGPPMPEELQYIYDHFYVYTHSLVLVGLVGLVCYLVWRRPPWLLLPYALHIAMDMISHERYQTPFLFPISRWTFSGYAWSRPPMFFGNWAALALTYLWLYSRYWSGKRPLRTTPWPEDGPNRVTPAADLVPT